MSNLQVYDCFHDSLLESGKFQPNDEARLPDDDTFVCLLRNLLDCLLDNPEHAAVLSGLAALLTGHFSPPGTRLDDADLVPVRNLLRSAPITVIVVQTIRCGFGFHFNNASCTNPSGYICFPTDFVKHWKTYVAEGYEPDACNLEFLLKATFLHELAHWVHTQQNVECHPALASEAVTAGGHTERSAVAMKSYLCNWKEHAEAGFYIELCAFGGVIGYDGDVDRATIKLCTHLKLQLPAQYIQEVRRTAFTRFVLKQWHWRVRPNEEELDVAHYATHCSQHAETSFFPSEGQTGPCDIDLDSVVGPSTHRLRRDCTGAAKRRILRERGGRV